MEGKRKNIRSNLPNTKDQRQLPNGFEYEVQIMFKTFLDLDEARTQNVTNLCDLLLVLYKSFL